jgi:Flp pilus assembly protein TadG
MNKTRLFTKIFSRREQDEKGQSIVLIVFALIGLLAFAGIAIDTGFTFARSSQLQAAVDAAALAAVTEVNDENNLGPANTKAGQFLNTNGVPVGTTIVKNGVPIATTMQPSAERTELGAMEYTLTVTWPVEHYFLQLVGWAVNPLTKSATAAYFPLADIYASRRVESGVLSTSNQSLFGPNICTIYGDPFSPWNSTWAPGSYTYHYRILIPKDYSPDVLRVELFDPDSMNQAANTHAVSYSANAHALDPVTFPLGTVNKTCTSADRRNVCLIQTGEQNLVDPNGDPPVELDQVNPFWFVRIDENRGAGAAPGNGSCGQPGSYDTAFNTSTLFELFYYAQNSDGTITKIALARYTGQTGDNVRDNGSHLTDMRWVSPGGTLLYDQPANVPVDLGSPGDFELNIAGDLPGILVDPGTGNKYVYLDVTALQGASENGFEIWAGPLYTDVSSDVNIRNIQVLNNPSVHASKGATVYAMGNLPMNSNFGSAVDIPLIYVGPELAGESVFISLFDTDSGAQPPITFYFDSIAQDDWSLTFGAGGADPDGVSGRCLPGSCNNQWVNPSYEIEIPGILDNCDWNNPTQKDCTPFYGGRLMANYIGGYSDTYGWQITVTGLPYLVK